MQGASAIHTTLVLTAMLVVVPSLGQVHSYTLNTLQSAESSEITVVDWRDKEVMLPEIPQKIVSLTAPCTVILYALGAGDKVVGADKYCIDYAKEGPSTFRGAPGNLERYVKFCDEVSNKPNLGSSWHPSIETIIGTEPDVVFMYCYSGTLEAIEELEALGMPVIGIVAKTFDDIKRLIRLIGEVVDAQEEADALISEMEFRLDVISAKVENLTRPKVYYEATYELKTVGGDTFSNWIIEIAGGDNIFKDTSGFPSISSEEVIVRNPDVIIFGRYLPIATRALKEEKSVADVLLEERPAWKDIEAVKDRRVHILPTYYATYDQRFIVGVELMAKWFHPGIYGVEKSIEKSITYVGSGVSASISTKGIALTQVIITVESNKCISEAMLSIRQISPDISLAPWGVSALKRSSFMIHIYRYLEIKLEPSIPENISEVKLSFYVENSWLKVNGLSEIDIALFRWNETVKSWDEVVAQTTNVNATHTFYEATSLWLSMFAIAGIKPRVHTPPVWEQPWLWGIVAVIAILTLIAVLGSRTLRRPKPT